MWVEINTVPLWADNRIVGLLGVSRDVTVRREEEEIKRIFSDRFFKAFMEVATPMAISAIKDGRYIDVNEAFTKVMGIDREDLIGNTSTGMRHISGIQRALILEQLARKGRVENLELEVAVKGGEKRYGLFNVTKIQVHHEEYLLTVITDITKQKEVEGELRKSELKVRAILDKTIHFIGIVTPEGTLVSANQTALAFAGTGPEEVIGKPFWATPWWTHSQESQVALRNAIGSAAAGSAMRFETTHVALDGTTHWIDFSLKPVYDNGEMLFLLAEGYDITDRKRAEETLRASEERYRTIFENTGNATVIIEEDTTISLANAEFERLSGYTRDEIVGKKHWTEFVVEEDLERMRVQHSLRRQTTGDALKQYEFRFVTRSGEIRHIYLTIDTIPGTKRSIASLMDITDRMRAEEALRKSEGTVRALLNANPETMLLVDRDGIILACNDIVLKRIGKPLHQLILTCFYDHFTPDVAEGRRTRVEEVFRTGEMVNFVDTREGRVYDQYYYPVLDENGQVEKVAIYAMDITERKRIEEELLRKRNLESIGTLAGGIAHDFNNLLMTVVGYTSLARASLPHDHETTTLLSKAEAIALKGKDLTQKLIAFSQGGAPARNRITLPLLISDALRLTPVGEKIEVICTIPDGITKVEGDKAQLLQAIGHILKNAYEAMPEGGSVHVTVSDVFVGPDDVLPLAQGKYVRISIEDSGTGIPPENLSKIFDPYFTTKAMGADKGLGLGLAIVYAIIRNHRGHIAVESTPSKGAVFHLYLPLSSEAPVVQIQRGTPKGREKRVLFMDGEEQLRDIGSQILSHLGYEVLLAKDGREVVDIYRKEMESGRTIDVVMLALAVKIGMDGREAINRLVRIDPHVRAIVSSGYIDDPVVSRYTDYGFKAAARKPYSLENLRDVLSDILAGP
jgi:PAS domain S-box-containing protein